jgi:hypothetical protein
MAVISRQSASLLIRLSLLSRVSGLCSSAAAKQPVHLLVDAPVRHLLEPRKKQLTLKISAASALEGLQPLRALRSELARHCQYEGQLLFKHGRRSIDTDAQLTSVLKETARHGATPTLRLLARDGATLPPPTTGEEPPAAQLPSGMGPVRLVSFFKFRALDADQRVCMKEEIKALLVRVGARGSVYVASEGINGQLSVPLSKLEELRCSMASLPSLGGDSLHLNVQHASLGTVAEYAAVSPYRKLIVREKLQVLTDGLETLHRGDGGGNGSRDGDDSSRSSGQVSLDWDRAGTEIDAAEWHRMLEKRQHGKSRGKLADISDDGDDGEGRQSSGTTPGAALTPLLLDCRNVYESDEGTFEGAEPLGTDVFSQSWDVLRSRLKDVPRTQPIMTFCTGGIRCVKTNAFLEQVRTPSCARLAALGRLHMPDFLRTSPMADRAPSLA